MHHWLVRCYLVCCIAEPFMEEHSQKQNGNMTPPPPTKQKYEQSTQLVYLVSEEFLDDIHVDFSGSTGARPETSAFKSWCPTSASFFFFFFSVTEEWIRLMLGKTLSAFVKVAYCWKFSYLRTGDRYLLVYMQFLLLLLMLEKKIVCIFCCCFTLQITLLSDIQYWFN